jgi:hypothetical protein
MPARYLGVWPRDADRPPSVSPDVASRYKVHAKSNAPESSAPISTNGSDASPLPHAFVSTLTPTPRGAGLHRLEGKSRARKGGEQQPNPVNGGLSLRRRTGAGDGSRCGRLVAHHFDTPTLLVPVEPYTGSFHDDPAKTHVEDRPVPVEFYELDAFLRHESP